MEWLIETLRVLREVRDWTSTRSPDRKRRLRTKRAVLRAVATAEATLEQNKPPVVAPLGPARSERRPPSDRPRLARKATHRPAAQQAIPLDQIDGHALSAIRRLQRHGFRAYLVGGCVRDLLLGITPKDFDVTTDARPEEVKSLFRNSRVIGRRFRLVHVYFRGGKIIEVATFRANVTSDDDDADLLIRRDNVFGTEEEDARRRDFTINGLFYDVTTGRIIDHVGGLADVRQRYLRMIGDPEIRLREDPVRILRAIRFTAKLDVRMDPDLNAAIRNNRDEIARCAPARVMEETLRLLRIGHAARTVELMDELGVLPVLLPEIRAYLDGHIPGVAVPVADEELPANAEQLRRHLVELDSLIAHRPVADEVVLGALLYAPLNQALERDDSGERDRNRAISDFLAGIGTRIHLTRRLYEHLRQIFLAQRALVPTSTAGPRRRRRRRVNVAQMVQKPFFQDALDLLEIHLRATDRPLDIIEAWRERADAVAAGRPVRELSTEGASSAPARPAAAPPRSADTRPPMEPDAAKKPLTSLNGEHPAIRGVDGPGFPDLHLEEGIPPTAAANGHDGESGGTRSGNKRRRRRPRRKKSGGDTTSALPEGPA